MQDVADDPGAYWCERAEHFGVSRSRIEKTLKRLGLSRKKTRSPPIAKARRRKYRRSVETLFSTPLI
jgi:hypothetical protein